MAIRLKNNNIVLKRLKQIPQLAKSSARFRTKKAAEEFLKTLQDGIRFGELQLEKLSPSSSSSKRSKGYQKPKTPLFGKGDRAKRTYLSMWHVVPIKSGFSVRIKSGTHHSGLRYTQIFRIHEFGATFNRGGTQIVIPPRPAFTRAFKKWLRKKTKSTPSKQVKKELLKFIKTGRRPNFAV